MVSMFAPRILFIYLLRSFFSLFFTMFDAVPSPKYRDIITTGNAFFHAGYDIYLYNMLGLMFKISS